MSMSMVLAGLLFIALVVSFKEGFSGPPIDPRYDPRNPRGEIPDLMWREHNDGRGSVLIPILHERNSL